MEMLPPELQRERQRLEKIFTVDTAMLKKITKRFGEELEDGTCQSNVATPFCSLLIPSDGLNLAFDADPADCQASRKSDRI